MNLLTTWTEELSAPIAQKLYDNRDDLAAEYREKGTLTLDSIIKVLGNPPRIPNSPDTDAMLEAWEEKAEYGRLTEIIETKIKDYAASI